MNIADILAAISLVNSLFINGQKLAVTLGGKEITDAELKALIEKALLQVAANRDKD